MVVERYRGIGLLPYADDAAAITPCYAAMLLMLSRRRCAFITPRHTLPLIWLALRHDIFHMPLR